VSSRFFRTLPLLVATVTLWLAGPEALPPALIALLLLASLALGPRIPADAPTQRLASLVVLILVIAGIRAAGIAVHGGPRLGAFAFGCALAPLTVAAMRLHLKAPDGGHVFTLMLGFVAMMACGATRLGPLYGALVASYLAAMISALRFEDAARVPAHRVPRRAALVGALIVALACLFTVGASLVLGPMQRYAQQRMQESFEDYMLARAAFTDSMHLGRMTRLLLSNRVVMRVRGPRVDRLRGAVLDRYDGRRWFREAGGAPSVVSVGRGPLAGSDVVEIRRIGDQSDRLFLPYDLAALATATGAVESDGYGIARQRDREGDAIAWLRIGPRAVLPVAPAGKSDLGLSSEIAGPLHRLAREWTAGARTRDEALRALEHHLRSEFTYSLSSTRERGLDPILDFLYVHRVGHCEYFASAMALMARTLGIPTRVVTGYRVAERNPYLGHYVVRERNAHAWIEAWLPERGWVTYDPTPMAELPQDAPSDESGASAIVELFAAGAGRVEDWLAERTIGELSIAAVLGLVVFAIVRALGARKADRARGPSRALAFSAPLDAYLAFEARLAKSGHRREPSEPLERFAARVPEGPGRLVLRYARLRYGGRAEAGDDARIEAELRAAAEAE
jgi:transglutaminase-like putative cysteine protease